ncbi:MAG: hydantoinase B/oxoprolinase family protein [Hyphomicrobiaceae bacterium]
MTRAGSNAEGPIQQQVIGRALAATASEMGIALLRNAFSSIVREAKDMSTAVFSPQGRLVAQADHIPILQSAMVTALTACLDEHRLDALTPESVLITNDPYRGCHHLNDIALFLPVFHEGERIGIVGAIAHHVDVGGSAAGMLPAAREVREEGICIPPLHVRLVDGDLPAVVRGLVAANVRAPDAVLGDLHAQIAALFSGRARLRSLAAKYGTTVLTGTMDRLIEAATRGMAVILSEIPDFDVTGAAMLDDDGEGGPEVVVRVRAHKLGDRITFDFAGTDAARPTMINANVSSALGAVWTATRHVFASGTGLAHNAGSIEPILVHIPPGSCLDPPPPYSVHARVLMAYRVYDAVMDALAKALPDRVCATGFNSSICLALSHSTDGRYNILVEVLSGGWGARSDRDGPDALPFALSNCANTPTEFVENRFPFLRIKSYGLVPGSAGSGRFRGGLGEIKEYDILADDVVFTVFTDRFVHPAAGLFGGQPGAPGSMEVLRQGARIPLTSKTGIVLCAGDVLRIIGGGGGGLGDPRQRAPEAAELDAAMGVVAGQ